ncbi:MAG: hypothetical protein H7645_12585 [Candidatus Heimdallarchaeota archaeon]|nr:hypothetical protein [Candidatus Heimdallarchaeota archaeon]MCK4771164.1 hypothetical protein [Candidatus Heimdallarchaeota archaeon]
MSSKDKGERKEFIKQIIRGVSGALVLVFLLIIWFTWDGIYNWFYTKVAPGANVSEGIRGDPLLLFWLVILFPLLAGGVALVVSGGWKAYRIAVPPSEED